MVTRRKKARQKQKKRGHLGKVPPILRNLPKGAKLIGAIPGMPKMSAVFLDFLEPYWKNEAQLRKLLIIGVIAWNAGCVTGEKKAALVEPTLALVPAEFREELKCMLDDMISRKETQFADDRRLILNYDLTMRPDGKPHLTVLFSPTPV
jgi:hypothetical protein